MKFNLLAQVTIADLGLSLEPMAEPKTREMKESAASSMETPFRSIFRSYVVICCKVVFTRMGLFERV